MSLSGVRKFSYSAVPLRAQGFVLLPVLLILAVIGSLALLNTQEGITGAKQAASQLTEEQARYSAEAGIAIATRELEQDVDCTGYSITTNGSFNGVNYTSALSANTGSPVTLTITTDQGDNSRDFSQEVTMYQQLEVLLDADADAYINSDSADTNYGNEEQLQASFIFAGVTRRSLVSFDLSGLSLTGSEIVSSDLELYLDPQENDLFALDVYTLEKGWVESQVTWRKRKNGKNWSSEGGDFNATRVARTLVDGTIPGLYRWDISGLTKDWFDAVTANHGVMLRVGWASSKTLASREYTTDTSKRPRLRINYKCECGVSCP